MTLYEYLKSTEEGTEVTVWDEVYDMESYFYNDEDLKDKWQTAMLNLAKKLEVVKVHNKGVEVNLSEVIELNIENLKETNLFKICTVDAIMDNIMIILSGYVSEEWMEKFVETLDNENKEE